MTNRNRDARTQSFPAHAAGTQHDAGPRLIAVSGPLKGAMLPLNCGETSIGRQPANTIVLASRGVSRRHCTITQEHDSILIADEESTNGTFVNGRPLDHRFPMQLSHGDAIRVFDTTFLFMNIDPDAVDPPAPLHIDFLEAQRAADNLLEGNDDILSMLKARRLRRHN